MSELLLAGLLLLVRSKLTPLMNLLLWDQCPLLARNLVELTQGLPFHQQAIETQVLPPASCTSSSVLALSFPSFFEGIFHFLFKGLIHSRKAMLFSSTSPIFFCSSLVVSGPLVFSGILLLILVLLVFLPWIFISSLICVVEAVYVPSDQSLRCQWIQDSGSGSSYYIQDHSSSHTVGHSSLLKVALCYQVLLCNPEDCLGMLLWRLLTWGCFCQVPSCLVPALAEVGGLGQS